VIKHQQQADSVLLYLRDHGQHVSSIDLQGVLSSYDWNAPQTSLTVTLHDLPYNKLQKLQNLELQNLGLQLQPGSGFPGVLQAKATLERLRLDDCMLLDEFRGSASVALSATFEPQVLEKAGKAHTSRISMRSPEGSATANVP
jgi:hypothetical protein